MTEGVFFQDLAVIMAFAGLAAALFTRFRWPKVLGYILVGVLMGSYTWGGSFLVDPSSVQTIGQLGVVFLMFTLGLGFSASEMNRIRNVVVPCALLDTIVMTWLGYTVGTRLLGWGPVPSLFLGAAICDSATTLLAKMIDEMRWSDRPFVKYVMGTSVCEDILCVGIIALITGVAQGSGVSVGAIAKSLGGLFVFFLATLVFGALLMPRILRAIGRVRDDESVLLTALGFCFIVSYVAWRFEFSLALGAFLVGLICSTSEARTRLNRLIEPLKAMFAAVFFVSIGILVDPAACVRHLPIILLLSAVVMVGKFVNVSLSALIAGERLKTCVQMGCGLAQIGEFAFMVALLYTTITRDETSPIFQVVVSVSLLTTCANPLLLKVSDRLGNWVEARCPPRVNRALEAYRSLVARFRTNVGQVSEARQSFRRAVGFLVLIGILNFAMAIIVGSLCHRDWSVFSPFLERHDQLIAAFAFNVYMIAMLVPMFAIGRSAGQSLGEILVGSSRAVWQAALRRAAALGALAVVLTIWGAQLAMTNATLLPGNFYLVSAMVVVLLVAAAFGWKRLMRQAQVAAKELREAMSADERRESAAGRTAENPFVQTLPENGIAEFVVAADSGVIGHSIVALNIRARTGATVIRIVRGEKVFNNPGPDWIFAASDHIVAYGEPHQVAAFEKLLKLSGEM